MVITLDAGRFAGRSLNCIKGQFVSDMTPCAPSGGFGLSAPTGTAALVKIVDRWQDHVAHDGGVVGATVTPLAISFTGSFIFDTKVDELWSFSVDRISGAGELKESDKAATKYECERVKPKL